MCETHYYREYRGSALGTGPIHPPCATCGAPISGNQSKFCSAKCGWTVRRLDWPGKLKNADFIHRARAKKHGVRWEVVDLMAIVERDGFNCQICGMPIDPEAPVRGKFSLSIDHIIPLAIGGSHTADNVRATHLVCNLGKAQTSDTPKAAKTKRQSDKHLGIRSAAKRPLPGTKASGIRKRMSGQVEEW
jgi:5-methylcytosine-specific restriction endonuclease McrA